MSTMMLLVEVGKAKGAEGEGVEGAVADKEVIIGFKVSVLTRPAGQGHFFRWSSAWVPHWEQSSSSLRLSVPSLCGSLC